MIKAIKICDICGKETKRMASFSRKELTTGAIRQVDMCPDCEEMILALAKSGGVLEGETDEEG